MRNLTVSMRQGKHLFLVLQESLVGLLLVEVEQTALTVRQHSVHVRLVLHCQVQRPETQKKQPTVGRADNSAT